MYKVNIKYKIGPSAAPVPVDWLNVTIALVLKRHLKEGISSQF